ncbi:transcription factor bHLH51-like isoform X1 [Lycium ferocissimum]|uniref:transcription factor bHLH51-like isoform X1 n=1 Tax=Lycium ferocissimum TaxID=112874 RepID=UPI00281679C9|nr:transcription factor bHLH51-like isoform X1 [Lycium ferocissimum]
MMDNSFWSDYWPQIADLNQDSLFSLPQVPNITSFHLQNYPESFQGGTASASRSHSEAEKRRRDRINAQLSTLRKLIPTSEKQMDKAALLGSVVDHVKDLKGKTTEISKVLNTPTDIDEVIIEHLNEEENKGPASTSTSKRKDNSVILKASFCCDDRPELFSELQRGIKNLKLTIIEADITTLGGRIKGIFLLCHSDNFAKDVCMNSLKQSLRVVLSRIAIFPSTSHYRTKSKRQRFFLPPQVS